MAKLSGVSVATVSRVFNGYADVSETTRQRVMATAKRLDYAPSAAALVIALGAALRRTVLAIGLAFIGYLTLRLVIQTWVRQNYVAPVRKVWLVGRPGPASLDTAWNLQNVPSDRFGHPLAHADSVFALCGSAPKAGLPACAKAHDLYNLAVYQPPSRFWLFQGIEAAIFGGLALALIAFAVWWVRDRVS